MKFTTLIPTHHNDARPVKSAVLNRLIDVLSEQFGGLTEEGTVRGVWTDDAGVLYHDASIKVSVVCANSRLGEAIRAVTSIGRKLDQLAMYFEVSGYDGVQILPIQARGRER